MKHHREGVTYKNEVNKLLFQIFEELGDGVGCLLTPDFVGAFRHVLSSVSELD